jgi:hypothetical protein
VQQFERCPVLAQTISREIIFPIPKVDVGGADDFACGDPRSTSACTSGGVDWADNS